MLAWIASCDGDVSEPEMQMLREVADGVCTHDDLRLLIKFTQPCQIDALQTCCDIVRKLNTDQRRQTLRVAMDMSLRDGFLTSAEGHIIRFLADLLLPNPNDLDVLFRELTGESFPPPSDPSSPDWWETRERKTRQNQDNQRQQADSRSSAASTTSPFDRLRDLAILGLDDTATPGEIKEAYRRMAQIHHPDKFATLGPEAIKSAEVTFQRLRAAYERLGGL